MAGFVLFTIRWCEFPLCSNATWGVSSNTVGSKRDHGVPSYPSRSRFIRHLHRVQHKTGIWFRTKTSLLSFTFMWVITYILTLVGLQFVPVAGSNSLYRKQVRPFTPGAKATKSVRPAQWSSFSSHRGDASTAKSKTRRERSAEVLRNFHLLDGTEPPGVSLPQRRPLIFGGGGGVGGGFNDTARAHREPRCLSLIQFHIIGGHRVCLDAVSEFNCAQN